MNRLLVLADDFTGALDTGIQFAKAGIRTSVYPGKLPDQLPEGISVLVVDTETRHLPPEEAAGVIGAVTRRAMAQGVRHFYKKTDSALRGNVGAELAALMKAAGQERLYFAPAYPAMNRVTENGVQYTDGLPVAESSFGRDPFNPVRCSAVRDIIYHTAPDAAVHAVPAGTAPADQGAGIYLFDALTDDDLACVVSSVRRDGVTLTAGCAGLAGQMRQLFPDREKAEAVLPVFGGMIVVSGSVNAVSMAQQRYAAGHGFPRFTLPPEQKLDPRFPQSDMFRELCGDILGAYRENRCVLVEAIDSVSAAGGGEGGYTLPEGMTQEQARATVADNMGGLAAALQARAPDTGGAPGTSGGVITVIIGGDTLLALIRRSGEGCLTPIAEPLPGVVLSAIERPGGAALVISKSGGFGEEDFLVRLREMLI